MCETRDAVKDMAWHHDSKAPLLTLCPGLLANDGHCACVLLKLAYRAPAGDSNNSQFRPGSAALTTEGPSPVVKRNQFKFGIIDLTHLAVD